MYIAVLFPCGLSLWLRQEVRRFHLATNYLIACSPLLLGHIKTYPAAYAFDVEVCSVYMLLKYGRCVMQGTVSNMMDENVVQPLLVSTSALNLATECVRMILKVRGSPIRDLLRTPVMDAGIHLRVCCFCRLKC